MSTTSVSLARVRRDFGAGAARVRRRCVARPNVIATRRFRKVWIAWQAQHFRKVGYRFCGRHCTFAKLGVDSDLVTGRVQIVWQR